MSSYLIQLVLTSLVLFGIHLWCFNQQLGKPTQAHAWVAEAYHKKEAIVSREEAGKLILVGGSGTLFSVSAAELQHRLGIPVVNFGVHAGVGPDYLLQRAAKSLKPGDAVLLIPEFNAYAYQGEVSETRADFLSAWDPEYIKRKPLQYLETALYFSIPEILERCWSPGVVAGGEGYYSVSHLSARGDKENIDADQTTIIQGEMLRRCRPLSLSFIEGSEGVMALDAFVSQARAGGVQVMLTFPTSLDFPDYRSNPAREFFKSVAAFAASRGIALLGEPSDFFYPADCFIDTQYHANREGRHRTTARLAKLLEDRAKTLLSPMEAGK